MDKKQQAMNQINLPLCSLATIPDGGAIAVDLPHEGNLMSFILLRSDQSVWGFINRCPHQGTPLETFPDKLLDEETGDLVCSTHGARFSAASGHCFFGPCIGAELQKIKLQRDGDIICIELTHDQLS